MAYGECAISNLGEADHTSASYGRSRTGEVWMPAEDTAPRTTGADTSNSEPTSPQISSSLLAAVLDTAPVALAVWGLDGTFLRVNQTFAQLTDRPADEHAGLS